MKNKVIISIIGIALVVSVGFNIYQLSSLNNANTQNRELQSTIAELKTSISNYEEIIADNEKSISGLELAVKDLQSENESLEDELESLEDDLESYIINVSPAYKDYPASNSNSDSSGNTSSTGNTNKTETPTQTPTPTPTPQPQAPSEEVYTDVPPQGGIIIDDSDMGEEIDMTIIDETLGLGKDNGPGSIRAK